MSALLEVRDLTVDVGGYRAVDSASFSLAPGEVLAVIGPSGSGKTTLLRAIAGLVPPTSGRVIASGHDVTTAPPHARGFGLMFQEHALFAHLDVGANVGFAPKQQKLAPQEYAARVASALDLVNLVGFESRSVGSLSGGEAQRVALARSLAARPRLLMLDEPLGSLDRLLRVALTTELRRLLKRERITAIHVTHDQEEAFAIADRVAVMRRGRIMRCADPASLWRDPQHEFVASFVGHRAFADRGGKRYVIRRDAVTMVAAEHTTALPAVVASARFDEGCYSIEFDTKCGPISLAAESPPAVGSTCTLHVDFERCPPVEPDVS